MTGSAIEQVNNVYFTRGGKKSVDKAKKTHEELQYEKKLFNPQTSGLMRPEFKRSCDSIKKHFSWPMSIKPASRCESMALPDNPTKNFIYLALLFINNKEALKGDKGFLKSPHFENLDNEKMEDTLRNGGYQGK